jgi:lipopolysaccharide export LptBFGC system permease protein LptF
VLILIYVLRQLVSSLLFAVAGLGLIVLPTIAVRAVNKLGAIDLTTVAQYLPLVVAGLVPYLMPMAFLLAVVATYGRLAAERELIAIQMAGIHPARLVLPGLVVALPLVFFTDRLLGEITPELTYRERNIVRQSDVARFVTTLSTRNVLQFGKNVLKSESTRGNVKTKVQLDGEIDGKTIKMTASEARIEVEGDALVVRMKDARLLTERLTLDNGDPVLFWRLSELFQTPPRNRNKASFQPNSELERQIADPKLEPAKREDFRYEIHRRHALSAMYLVFLLLGLPTGVVLRSSTQLGALTVAIGYALLYYVLAMRLGKVLADNGALPPIFAAWATNGLFVLVGGIFFARALLR